MSIGQELKGVIQEIAVNVIQGGSLTSLTYAELVSIEPLVFKENAKLTISGVHLITPRYRAFTEDDIGKKFAFMKNAGGQDYFYLYEAAPKGHNGVPYSWSGEIEECELIGTCPTGEVKVTHGKITLATHERGENI